MGEGRGACCKIKKPAGAPKLISRLDNTDISFSSQSEGIFDMLLCWGYGFMLKYEHTPG
jgi:hypothetical protein